MCLYGIPPDNPFVGLSGDDEIWSFGLRNPWRNAFDRDSGDLYIVDLGGELFKIVPDGPAGVCSSSQPAGSRAARALLAIALLALACAALAGFGLPARARARSFPGAR